MVLAQGSVVHKLHHKTLLPLYDRPVIDYAMKTRAGRDNEMTIIANRHIGQIAKHLGSGEEGEKIHYVIEDKPGESQMP